MATPEQPEIVGRYALYGAVASGGMATVHLGRLAGPAGFSRTVAIKRMHRELLAIPEFVSMFADEARVAGRIRHPNVVPVIDVVSTKTELLLVMEYVHGEPLHRLDALARDSGGIPPAIGAAIVRDVLTGLHAAHETRDERGNPLDIVHRDVSPQNVIVGADGVARVLDFGVAKALGRAQVTREGEFKGKLAYVAPEQLHGEVSRSADIFAASIVLWEVLTQKRLFRGDTDAETVGKVLGAPILRPSEVVPSLGTAFDDVVMRGLERDPLRRYATARDMAADLARVVALPDAAAVGEWVAETARERLDQREKMVSSVETSHSSLLPHVTEGAETRSDSLAPADTKSTIPPRRRRRSPLYVALPAGVLVAAFVVAAIAKTPSTKPAEPAPTPLPPALAAATAAPEPASAPSAEPAPSGSQASAATPPASAGKVTPAAARTNARPSSKPTATPRIPDHL